MIHDLYNSIDGPRHVSMGRREVETDSITIHVYLWCQGEKRKRASVNLNCCIENGQSMPMMMLAQHMDAAQARARRKSTAYSTQTAVAARCNAILLAWSDHWR